MNLMLLHCRSTIDSSKFVWTSSNCPTLSLTTSNVHLITFVNTFKTISDNLALRKPAWQQNPFSYQWGADKSVDGLYSILDAGGNQCTISQSGHITAELRVDLEGVFSIHHIFIQYRTDEIPWGKFIEFIMFSWTHVGLHIIIFFPNWYLITGQTYLKGQYCHNI